MRNNDIQSHVIGLDATLHEALEQINRLSGRAMTLFAVDGEGRMRGTLTDGDIRRGLIGGAALTDKVADVMNRSFRSLRAGTDRFRAVREARRHDIDILPVLDADDRIEGIADLRTLKEMLPVDVVLMAGGRGERLRPLTLDTPKPLLEVGGKPIIDYNVDELLANGVEKIYVTVNYLKEKIIDHFSREPYAGKVECIAEPRRLGTLGSLSLVSEFHGDDVIVMNSDLLTSLDFGDLYSSHKESGAALTMAVVPYTVSVPFAIVSTDDSGYVKGLSEKPVYNYLANAGVYIMRRDIARSIPEGEYLDAPDFIERLIASGEKIGYYPIDGIWIDIGSPDDFRNAQKIMEGKEGKTGK